MRKEIIHSEYLIAFYLPHIVLKIPFGRDARQVAEVTKERCHSLKAKHSKCIQKTKG